MPHDADVCVERACMVTFCFHDRAGKPSPKDSQYGTPQQLPPSTNGKRSRRLGTGSFAFNSPHSVCGVTHAFPAPRCSLSSLQLCNIAIVRVTSHLTSVPWPNMLNCTGQWLLMPASSLKLDQTLPKKQ